jgi:DNA-binding Lrp family transcriptional regulator
MDPLDFAIYRFLSPDGEARFWAGRRVIDPNVPAREIAERVGISENGVRSRLRGLTNQGFLRGKAVTPNPSLFGVRTFVAELPIDTAADAVRVFHDLALVEGVVFARDTLDEGERHVGVYFVSDSDTATSRRAALIRRLSPKGQLRTPQPYFIPECEREFTSLDWRLLETLCRDPDASLAEVAKAVRISLKTAARRYHQLIESRGCWWTHGPEAEEFPLSLVWMNLRTPSQRENVTELAAQTVATWMPAASDGLGLEEKAAASVVAGLVPADAPAVLERWVKKLASLPGVESVRRTFALGSMSYPTWFSERIASQVKAS